MPSPSATQNWKRKALFLGMESAYNTDPVLVAGDWFEARNVSLTPIEAETQDRNIVAPWLGNSGKTVVARREKLSFDAHLGASGALGVAPKIDALLRGLGLAKTVTAGVKVEYTLIDEDFESLAYYMSRDQIKQVGLGVRGNGTFILDAKGVPMVKAELSALYSAPTDSAPMAPTLAGWPAELPVNAANTQVCTLNAVNCFYNKFQYGLGNQVQHHVFGGGHEEVRINDRKPTASISILAETLAVFNPFALMEAQTLIPVQVVHGTVAGSKWQVDVKARITGVTAEEIDGLGGWSLTLEPGWSSGLDEFKLTQI